MTALKQSLKGGSNAAASAAKAKKPTKRSAGQKEMLLPISGKKEPVVAKKVAKPATAKTRKAG
jgi:DNA end-binding protein Ku